MAKGAQSEVRITAGLVELEGELALPDSPLGMVLFAHGSGSPCRGWTAKDASGTFSRTIFPALRITAR